MPTLAEPEETVAWEEHLGPASAWRTDRRLSPTTALSVIGRGVDERGSDGGALVLESTYPGTAAAVLSGVFHWAGARHLEVPVDVPAEGDGSQLSAFVRVGKETIYESALTSLEPGSHRLKLPFHGDGAWVEPGGRALRPYDLLTIREVGLRVFHHADTRFAFRVGVPRVVGPGNVQAAAPGPAAAEPLSILPRGAPPQQLPRLGRFELDFDLSRVFRNPFDPDTVAVELEVRADGDEPRRHPAFFRLPYELRYEDGLETPERAGRAAWTVRFCPWRVGEHRWRLVARAGGEEATLEGRFRVLEPAPNSEEAALGGFVRVSTADPRYLELGVPGSGDALPYYPIGPNLRSPADERPGAYGGASLAAAKRAKREGTRAYGRWLRALGEAGGDFGRMWLAPWWGGLEWNAEEDDGHPTHAVPYSGLGFYHQANAARVDRVLELAETHGVRLAIETLPHGLVSSHIDADWHRSPYNTRNGGPVVHATDFFRDEASRRLHRHYLRYVVARWGASPAVAWWGLLTEVEWSEPYYRSLPVAVRLDTRPGWPEPYATPETRPVLLRWLEEMAAHLKKMDAHPHPTTAQFSIPAFGLEAWERPGLDIVHNNAYLHLAQRWQVERFEGGAGIAEMLAVFSDTYAPPGDARPFAKPVLVGEWGGHPKRNQPQALLAELHVGTWAGFMTGLSGSTGFWWWNLVDAEDAWNAFGALARFAEGVDRRGRELVSREGEA
ncbi:MAG: hypothetical protein MI919_10265, partial [Holophagales bacterium]|nr:hypothetical protein [Holophagales bacterium]